MKKTNPKPNSPFPEWYSRNLPHWQPPNAVLFVTTCLDGALPKHRIEEIKAEQEKDICRLHKKDWPYNKMKLWLSSHHDHYFGKYDALLDNPDIGPQWLKDPAAAEIIVKSLLHFHGQHYKLICFTIMSNHIHIVWYKLDRILWRIMQSFKQYTSKRINRLIGQTGTLWQAENWDCNIRNRQELLNKIRYTLNNPVKAGIVDHWKEYPHNWLNPEFAHWAPD